MTKFNHQSYRSGVASGMEWAYRIVTDDTLTLSEMREKIKEAGTRFGGFKYHG